MVNPWGDAAVLRAKSAMGVLAQSDGAIGANGEGWAGAGLPRALNELAGLL